ncbi:MAG: FHA domain-containing protein, partial [Vicinamibacterales bacterium]
MPAKLILKIDDRELHEYAVGPQPVSIGRLPDNHIIIDNPTVSGRHARVYREGDQYVLEDLKSTNGTFVNDKPIARHTLLEGDVILVGKHTLSFTQKGGEPLGGRASQVYDPVAPKTAAPTVQARLASVTVLAGRTTQPEFVLAGVTTMIGTADTAQIRLTGWFKPKAAAAIARSGDGYAITPMAATLTVNGEPVVGRRQLASGDLIEVSG